MSLDRLTQLIGQLRTLYAAQLGRFDTGGIALAVDPGPIPTRCTGIRCVVQRVPFSITDGSKVSGGTYFEDLFKMELVNFLQFSEYSTDPQKANAMRSLIREIHADFRVGNARYIPPSAEGYERALINIKMPCLVLRDLPTVTS